MVFIWFTTLAFGLLVVIFPNLISYLIWWLLIFIWINIIAFNLIIKKSNKKDSYVQFWDYKIYRWK